MKQLITIGLLFLATVTETVSAQNSQNIGTRYFEKNTHLDAKVDSIYRLMTHQERAAQMIMTASSPAEKLGYPYSKAAKQFADGKVANVVFLKGTASGFKQEAKQFNSIKTNSAQLPPLLACDCEPTLMPMKWTDSKGITPASEQKTIAEVQTNTQKINQIVNQVGVQLNFAPVVDIAANKSVINKRSFGNNGKTIATLSQQFVSTSQDAGIGATLKHFPGHGAVSGDSHHQSVFIDGALTELPTFQQILQSDAKPIAVMVGHIVVKNNTKYSTDGLPATLSRKIVTDLLRKELGFNGIITTDALNMQAAAIVPDADWKAVLAGIDLVLMPKNAVTLHQKITAALDKNDTLAKQIETSVKRIIRYKLIMN